MFKVYATTPESMGPWDIGAHAARAEAMGFDGLQVPDAIHDGLLLAALALQATRRLRVGTSVLVAGASNSASARRSSRTSKSGTQRAGCRRCRNCVSMCSR